MGVVFNHIDVQPAQGETGECHSPDARRRRARIRNTPQPDVSTSGRGTHFPELPLWILVPDLPVPKHSKQPLRDLQVNGGMHLHGMAAIPPNTRLNARLDLHFEIDQNRYVKPGFPLSRIHAKAVTERLEYTAEYAFRSIKRGNFDFADVLILPHDESEMSDKKWAPSRCPIRHSAPLRRLL